MLELQKLIEKGQAEKSASLVSQPVPQHVLCVQNVVAD